VTRSRRISAAILHSRAAPPHARDCGSGHLFVAAAVTRDPALLRTTNPVEQTLPKLLRLPGIGDWTAAYIAMRALREPDAFPLNDLGLLRTMRRHLAKT
jgi:3-methyladenine DNA glycosylase/8-oxoguanine DNA glycosylase